MTMGLPMQNRARIATTGLSLLGIVALVLPTLVRAQAAGCDQGVVRLPDSTGTLTICSALAAQVPQLARQLADASRQIGAQSDQLRELMRLVKGLNAAGAGLTTERQGRMLASLSAELARAEKVGGDRPKRTLEDLGDQLDALRDQLIANLGQERSAAATRKALQGPVGDSIAQLELRSAGRQLDDISQRLAALQSDVGEVKAGVASANETLNRIEKAVDPAVAADRCADLACAIEEGASASAVQKLFGKGARLPGNTLLDGELLKLAAVSAQQDRLQVLDLLFQHGLDSRMMIHPHLTNRGRLTPFGRQMAESVARASRLEERAGAGIGLPSTGDPGLDRWNEVSGCLLRSSRGVSLLELAALMGDTELFRYLGRHGDVLPTRELRCDVHLPKRVVAAARISIDPKTAQVRVEAL